MCCDSCCKLSVCYLGAASYRSLHRKRENEVIFCVSSASLILRSNYKRPRPFFYALPSISRVLTWKGTRRIAGTLLQTLSPRTGTVECDGTFNDPNFAAVASSLSKEATAIPILAIEIDRNLCLFENEGSTTGLPKYPDAAYSYSNSSLRSSPWAPKGCSPFHVWFAFGGSRN